MKYNPDYEDHDYWNNLDYPKIPNEIEVNIFRENIFGNILLLGETKNLRCLTNNAIDLFPTDFAKKCDWYDIDGYYDCIIGDGVLNIGNGLLLLDTIKNHCDRFVCRVFGTEIEHEYSWKYAKYFYDKFPNSSKVIKTQKGVYIVIYNFI